MRKYLIVTLLIFVGLLGSFIVSSSSTAFAYTHSIGAANCTYWQYDRNSTGGGNSYYAVDVSISSLRYCNGQYAGQVSTNVCITTGKVGHPYIQVWNWWSLANPLREVGSSFKGFSTNANQTYCNAGPAYSVPLGTEADGTGIVRDLYGDDLSSPVNVYDIPQRNPPAD